LNGEVSVALVGLAGDEYNACGLKRSGKRIFIPKNETGRYSQPQPTESIMSQPTNQPQMPEITATELKQRLDHGDDIQIIDVREPDEYQVARLPNSIHIPLGQVVNRMSEIDPARETVVHCKAGGRSARAIEALKRAGFNGQLTNLKGGITAWSNEVDPSVPKY
jgi:rhodanese-related sulfurtransferase